MSVNPTIGMVGVAKQASRTTPAAAPEFTHGLTGGQNFKVDRSIEKADVACGARAGTDSYVDEISTGVDFETYGYADALPLYLHSVLGNVASTPAEGKDGYFDHVCKLGKSLPYLTFWGLIGEEDVAVTESAKIDQIEISFEGNAPVEFGITAIGCQARRLIGQKEMPGGVEPSCFDGYFVPTDGSFKLDTASDAPAEAFVTAGSMTLANSVTEYRKAGQVMPDDVAEKKLTSSGSVTVKPDDLQDYWKMVTGSASGATPSGKIVYGSLRWAFSHSADPDMQLVIEAKHIPFTCEYPSVDPEGDAATLEFAFDDIGITEKAGSPVTATVRNKTSDY